MANRNKEQQKQVMRNTFQGLNNTAAQNKVQK